MTRAHLLLALTCALGAAACTSTAGTGGGGSGGGTGGTGGIAEPPPITAIAFRTTNDGMLYLELADYALGCSGSFPDQTCLTAGQWRASIGIPPALQMAGSFPLSSAGIVTDSAESGSGGNDCCFCGGGSFSSGTMEIVSIDAGSLVVKLSGTTTYAIDGEYTAEICP